MNTMLEKCWEGVKSFGAKVKETAVDFGHKAADKSRELCAAAVGVAAWLLSGVDSVAQEFEASDYIAQMNTAATQIKGDVAAALPIALGVAAVSVGIFIVWRVFKRLANG